MAKRNKEQESLNKRKGWERRRQGLPKEFTDVYKASQYELCDLPVESIFSDEDFNCRNKKALHDVAVLAESIKAVGLISPVSVLPAEGDYDWKLAAGHRRYDACRYLLKWDTIPAFIVRNKDEREARIFNFTENVKRKQLNIMEEARWLVDTFGEDMVVRQVAKKIGEDQKWVIRRKRLLGAPAEVQQAAEFGRLSEKRLDEVLKISDPSLQVKLLNKYMEVNEKFVMATAGPIERAKGQQHNSGSGRAARPPKEELIELMGKLLNIKIAGLEVRLLSYAAGWISKEQIEQEIMELQREGYFKNRGEQPTQPESYSFHPANQERDPD